MHTKKPLFQSFSVNGKTTIDTKDSRYQRTIGQRSELAFSDIKVVNLAYCQGMLALLLRFYYILSKIYNVTNSVN